jgi:hypothetical protein
VPKEDLELFLTQKAGFHLRDVGQILAISKTIDMAKTSDMKIPLLSKKILDLYGVDKTMNAYRLFKALGYTELALAIKKEKNTFVSSKDMTLTLEMIMNAFIVDEKEGKKILEDAKNAVITSPELMNDSAKLLIILNKQRSKEHSHT